MPTTTPSLNKLPLELRTDIWKKSFPDPEFVTLYPDLKKGSTILFEHCVYGEDGWGPVSDETDDEDEIMTYEDQFTSQPRRYLPPQQIEILALLHTCKESRDVATKAYNVQLPMSLGRTWRMDGNRDTFIPISMKNAWRRPLRHTPHKYIWNDLMRNVKHIALLESAFSDWTDDNKAWFVAQFPGLKTLSLIFTHECCIATVISLRYEERITTREDIWRNPEFWHRQLVSRDMPRYRAILQRYKDKIDSSFDPPTLIALATHSGDEDPAIELYGRHIDYSVSDGAEDSGAEEESDTEDSDLEERAEDGEVPEDDEDFLG